MIKSISVPKHTTALCQCFLKEDERYRVRSRREWVLVSQVISYKDEDFVKPPWREERKLCLNPSLQLKLFCHLNINFCQRVGILLRNFPILTHHRYVFLRTSWLWSCSFKVEMEEVGKVVFIQVKGCYESISHLFLTSLIPWGDYWVATGLLYTYLVSYKLSICIHWWPL